MQLQEAFINEEKRNNTIIKLLEVKNKKKEEAKEPKPNSNHNSAEKPKIQKAKEGSIADEELQMMIKQKLDILEPIQNGSDKPSAYQLDKKKNEEVEAMQLKLTDIYKNKNTDNKQKIEEMAELFNGEVMEYYKNCFMDIVNASQEQVTNEYLSEFHTERAKTAEVIVKKYGMLSTEYQNQSKEFKRKH